MKITGVHIVACSHEIEISYDHYFGKIRGSRKYSVALSFAKSVSSIVNLVNPTVLATLPDMFSRESLHRNFGYFKKCKRA